MSTPAKNATLPADDLSAVPGLGPVRRRLLAEAGITTRAGLAAVTPDQIVSVTGMPRGIAEQVAAFVASSLPPVPSPSGGRGEPEEDAGDDVSLAAGDVSGSPLPPEGEGTGGRDVSVPDLPAPGEDAPPTTRLERAALRAQTAIADASRRAEPDSKLSAMLLRFAALTDELPRRVTPQTRGGVLRRITERIEAITARLETVAGGKKEPRPLGSKRAKRLEQRLKRTRDSIKRTLKTSASN